MLASPGNLGLAVVTTTLDLVARLSAPISVLALANGHGRLAVGAAFAVSVLGVARGVVSGALGQRVALALWRALVRAVGNASILSLHARPADQQGWRVVDAAHRVTELHAHLAPRAVADAAALIFVAAAVIWRLGIVWLMVGATTLVVLGLFLWPAQRAVRRADERVWRVLTDVGTDLDIMLDAPAEIRAHGHDDRIGAVLLERVAEMALEQRRIHTYSALVGLFPLGIALLAAAAPFATGALDELGVDLSGVADVGVLGGAGLVFGIGLVRTIESWMRAIPHRRMLEALQAPPPVQFRGQTRSASWLATIRFEGVEVVYPDADAATPGPVDHVWGDQRGLALVGANGAGKTTLALALLGLIEPTAGTIWIGDERLDELDIDALRARTIYLPQSPFLAPERPVGWHLALAGPPTLSRTESLEALRAVGLDERLRHHAAGRGGDLLAIPAGELSGGERRRLHLARLFLPRPEPVELVVVDEPEAGLDDEGRATLESRLAALSEHARVLLVAHGTAVIPEHFDRLACDQSS